MILVFDEATSALDSETESLVMDLGWNSLSGENYNNDCSQNSPNIKNVQQVS